VHVLHFCCVRRQPNLPHPRAPPRRRTSSITSSSWSGMSPIWLSSHAFSTSSMCSAATRASGVREPATDERERRTERADLGRARGPAGGGAQVHGGVQRLARAEVRDGGGLSAARVKSAPGENKWEEGGQRTCMRDAVLRRWTNGQKSSLRG
jgi:hypothetical protein